MYIFLNKILENNLIVIC